MYPRADQRLADQTMEESPFAEARVVLMSRGGRSPARHGIGMVRLLGGL